MGLIKTLLPLLISLILAGCQVKSGSSDGGLISGHLPTTNTFTVLSPTAKTYIEGEAISYTLTFPFEMVINTTGGSPRLKTKIGATTRYATYVPDADLTKLVFTYTIVAGDNDTNGIDVVELELNGSSLQFDKDGVMTNCGVSSVTTKNFPSVKVDTAVPTVSTFKLNNLPGLYNAGEKISFSVTYSEVVTVTGSPYFRVSLSGTLVNLTYLSGSGTKILNFSYTIGTTVSDVNGFNSIETGLTLGGATIKDVVGLNASLSFAGLEVAQRTYSSAVKVNGAYPFVVGFTVPANGTYLAAQNLDFIAEFDREVNVTGVPILELTIGSNTRQAQYISGHGTKFLTFRYTAVPGDVDTDGIAIVGYIKDNSATANIVDTDAITNSYFTDTDNHVFTKPSTAGIILNALQPQPLSVTRNTDITNAAFGTPAVDNTWNIGQVLLLTVNFNTGIFVNTTMGTPTLEMTFGATPKEATYLSGGNGQTALIFTYTVTEGDLDLDGTINLGNIVLNGGTMVDASNTISLLTIPAPATLTNTKIDGVRPFVSSVTGAGANTYSSLTPMPFTVTWNEPVDYSTTALNLSVSIGGINYNAPILGSDLVAAITHRRTLTLNTENGAVVVNSPLSGTAVVTDSAGNTAVPAGLAFTPPDTTGYMVDTRPPRVATVTAITANGSYKTGDNIDFSVVFDESVTILRNVGYPRLTLNVGGSTTRFAVATTNGTGTTHTFRYTVAAGHTDIDGINVINVFTNNATGYARDAGLNNAVAGGVTLSTGIIIDTTAPATPTVTKPANGTYTSGDTLEMTLTYAEDVVVTGSPVINLSLDSGVVALAYDSGASTARILRFNYTLTNSDFDMMNGIASVSSVSSCASCIKDVAGNNAPTTFAVQTLSSVFVTYPGTDLWVTSSFVNLVAASNTDALAISNAGAISTETIGGRPYRVFNGGDNLVISDPTVSGITTAFIVFKTATSATTDYELFQNHIDLQSNSPNDGLFDLVTSNGTLILNNVSQGAGTTFDVNVAESQAQIVQMDFSPGVTLVSGDLFENNFDGSVAEIIIIRGGLGVTEKNAIRAYLETKY